MGLNDGAGPPGMEPDARTISDRGNGGDLQGEGSRAGYRRRLHASGLHEYRGQFDGFSVRRPVAVERQPGIDANDDRKSEMRVAG